ncbi:TAT-variant-translocated molybdopterin oxidoreductase [Puniceicoccales bacterium CK1056]|uniref:TAT-variant-translocated molybdopterin oxidoreductase n=2 Tax=Oceanipulchritudo coccoides TaxID=2706888 RepID=A0A6B2LXX3_9BACT|nr:TAT-variant-translocated molybdopterin oxidoreductase [Oceanipulchritudo coccoides]
MTGPHYWRSLDELADKPAFKEWLHREFPEGASEAEGVNRRNFLKIMAASFAVAGMGAAGCRRPEQYILPYSKQPEGTIPGIPVYFTTSFPDGKDNLPLVVETHQHRPTHIEGNRDFLPYGGGISRFASASVLNLYDPDRMTSAYEGTRRISSERVKDILAGLSAKFGPTNGQGMAILAEPSTSPTRLRLKKAILKKYPRLVWAEYSAVDQDNPERAAARLLGRPARPLYDLEKAKRILSVDADFLNDEPGSVGLARSFSRTRKVKDQADAKKMARLYVAESAFTLTGTMGDHRLRLSTGNMTAFMAALVAELLELTNGDPRMATFLRERSSGLPIEAKWIHECARDLVDHPGKSVVVPGTHLSVEAQQLAIYANQLLGALDKTVSFLELPEDSSLSLSELAGQIKSGSIESLLVMGGNPVYDAPADLDWKALQKSVPEVIRFGYYFDETSLEAGINIAATHFLESWSDGRTLDGTYVPVQPMIMPLFDSMQELELLGRLAGEALTDPYGMVLSTFSAEYAGSDKDFQRLLSTGFLPESGYRKLKLSLKPATLRENLNGTSIGAKGTSASNLEVRLVADASVGNGFYNNNGWLQECPDPITKLTWDNAILISPALALELGFDTKAGDFLIGGVAKKSSNFKRGREESRIAELTVDGVTVRGPVHIQPGLDDWTVVLPLGYGRTQVGRVGKGSGFSAYPLSHSGSGAVRTGAKITLTDEGFRLANTQEHWSMEGRAILREGNVKTYLENSKFVSEMGMESHSPPIYGTDKDMPLAEKALTTPRGGSAYETPDFGAPPPNVDVWSDEDAREKFIPEQQWGMTIDLNSCTGCNACVVACQSENNIPIVGKDQIMRGREMHWIRLDRYYSTGDLEANRHSLPSDPQASIMPVGCLHCEMAPCEQVCPVNATVHDRQGLNVMAYNRCVGTRYCANNCPYKVRRFNFFDYNKRSSEDFYKGPVGTNQYKTEGGVLKSMQKNPDVTVRMRGVMEKCTYCVQRIEQGKIAQRVKAKDSNDIRVPDGVIRTACQAACPSEAIVFGDITDEKSAVAMEKANDRDYALLGYLNTRPRTTYLARLRNPNPLMPDYRKALSRKEYKSAQPVTDHGAKTTTESHDGGH